MTSTTRSTRSTGASTESVVINITLTDAQLARLGVVGVDLTGSEPALETAPVVEVGTGATHTNAGGRLVYSDGPNKGKFAPAPKAKRATKAQKAKAAKSEAFVGWLRETAEQRAARKNSNAVMAKFIRDLGFQPTGRVWDAVKAGERTKKALAPLAALDKADVEARKAERAAANA